MMMLLCIKQHLKLMKKLSNTKPELKKSVAYKKVCIDHKSLADAKIFPTKIYFFKVDNRNIRSIYL